MNTHTRQRYDGLEVCVCVCVRERERERKRQAADFCWVPVSVDGSPAAWGRSWLSSRWLSETELGGCSGGMDGKRRRERGGGERGRENEGRCERERRRKNREVCRV